MSHLMSDDILEVLREENRRLLAELWSANKCREMLIEIKSFVKSIFEKYENTFDSQDFYAFKSLVNGVEDVLAQDNQKNIKNKESNQTIVHNKDNKQMFQLVIESVDKQSMNSEENIVLKPSDNGKKKKKTNQKNKIVIKDKTKSKSDKELEQMAKQKSFKCDSCDQLFAKRIDLNKHIAIHFRTEWHCTVDGLNKVLKDINYLKTHLYRTHSQKEPRLRCKWSGCPFIGTMLELKKHKMSHRSHFLSRYKFVCDHPNCFFRAYRKCSLQKHLKTKHRKDRVERMHVCGKCGQEFGHLDAYVLHMKTEHNIDKPFICDFPDCEYSTALVTMFNKHKLLKHTDSDHKPYVCTHCGKGFKLQSALKKHLTTHLERDKYCCEWPGCDYKTPQSRSLKIHKLTHTKERNVVCDVEECDKRFRTNYEMKVHKRSYHKLGPLLTCQWPGCDYTTYHPITYYSHSSHHKLRNK